ncbi:glucosyl transferase, partial [Escherichia coli]|nr:glucosyl transferase [Escherichia coli]
PEAGYFQTFSRLTAIASLSVPLAYAPLFFYLTAIAVQISVAGFIASERLSDLLPDKKWRLALAFGYLAMPHSWEIYANVTNSQWHLALL